LFLYPPVFDDPCQVSGYTWLNYSVRILGFFTDKARCRRSDRQTEKRPKERSVYCINAGWKEQQLKSSAFTKGPRDAPCRWKFCCHSESLKVIPAYTVLWGSVQVPIAHLYSQQLVPEN